MKRFLACVWFLLATVAVPGWSLAEVYSTFNEDLDGWTCASTGTCTWNSRGFLEFEDGGGARTEAVAPEKFQGDWSAYSGVGAITFSHQVTEPGDGVSGYLPYQIVIEGVGELSAVWTTAYSSSFLGRWVPINAALVDSHWNVTGGTLLDVLEDITEIRIAVEVVENSGTGGNPEIAALDDVGIAVNQACWCPASVGSARCGQELLRGSEVLNDLGMFIIPIGALVILRIRYRKK